MRGHKVGCIGKRGGLGGGDENGQSSLYKVLEELKKMQTIPPESSCMGKNVSLLMKMLSRVA